MPERLKIATIHKITDDDTGNYFIGEIEAGFDQEQLTRQIENHGVEELLKGLAYMNWQVWNTMREVNANKNNLDGCKASQ